MSFKEQCYEQTHDGRRPITIAHLEPSAQVSTLTCSFVYLQVNFLRVKPSNPLWTGNP